MKIIFVYIFLSSFLLCASINEKLFDGEFTELNIYYTQIKNELNRSVVIDETSKERLKTERNLLSRLQDLTKIKPKSINPSMDFFKKKVIHQKDFLRFFNYISKKLVKQKNIKKNRLIIQRKLAFLKSHIENIVVNKKDNLRLYQLQFAYYKLIQLQDKNMIEYLSTSIADGEELMRLNIDKVRFDTVDNIIKKKITIVNLNKITTKLISINLQKERELLYSDTISTALELKLNEYNRDKNRLLKEKFNTLTLLALSDYQEHNIKIFLHKQKEIKETLNKISRNQLYKAKYSLFKYISSREIDSMVLFKDMIDSIYDSLALFIVEPLFVYNEKGISIRDILKALLIMFLGFIIAKIYHRKFIKLHNSRKDMSTISIKVIGNFGFVVIFVISALFAISSIGISLTSLAVIAGALSIGMGFALRNVVSDYIAGVLVLSENNIRMGHFIKVGENRVCKVVDIGLRATTLRSIDNTHFIIPNSQLIENDILNLTLNDRIRRIYIPFKVGYGTDIKMVRSLIIKVVNESNLKILRDIYGKKPTVWMRSMEGSFIQLNLLVWVEGYRPSLKSTILILIYETLNEHNISMPYPQLDLHIKKP